MVWVKSTPPPAPTLTPFFIILIILNIVQNLSLHLSMPFILCLHPPYPTSPIYPNLATPTPSPTPDRTPGPARPSPPPPKFFFWIFTKTSLPRSHPPWPPTRRHPPPPPPPYPSTQKKIIFKKASLLRSHPLWHPPTPPPTWPHLEFFFKFHKSLTSPFTSTSTVTPPPDFFFLFTITSVLCNLYTSPWPHRPTGIV